ncbi:MAG: DNA repair protein RadC [Betaproteobacteria bacterium]|jgi:DNA replication and repair protein RadC|nr:DNA repair protein RadC [Betaproteobacteria bacterium]
MNSLQHWTNTQLLACLFGLRGGHHYRACEETLEPLFSATEGRWQRKGAALREVFRRWLEECLQRGEVLGQPDQVKNYLRLIFKGQAHESFWVLYLNAQHQLIVAEELFRGTLTQTAIYPREVLKAALRHNAAALLLAHNHPSGKVQPSHADRQLTEVLKRALELVDIQVLDHFVVAGPDLASFAEMGWI